jgi:hypothetical protein
VVNKAAIARNLRELNSRFNRKSRNPRDPLYFSKLALLELCGWIELTMDQIVRDCARKRLTDAANLKHVEENVIERTHNFAYAANFRPMLIQVVGLVNVEDLERRYDPAKFDLMESSLDTLRQQRNREAHTYVSGVTPTVDAPSVIINTHFPRVYYGLKDIESCVHRLKI